MALDLDSIFRKGFDDFRELINPPVALRVELTGEPYKVVKTRNGRMVLADGTEIEDFHGTQAFGHRHPAVTQALKEFLDSDAPNWFPARVNPFAGRLARRLAERTGYTSSYFAHSGTEAVEAALKLARAVTRKPRILGLDRAYHGCTYGSVALMSHGTFRDVFAPHLPGVESIPHNDVAALEAAFAQGGVGALIVEPIQLEGGVRPLSPEYIAAACRLTKEHGALLIADEVQTGMGRTGHLAFTETWPRRPDVVLLAKSLGGGLVPCAAMLTSAELFDRAYGQDFETAEAHNNTFSGHALSSVAALTALDLLTDDVLKTARAKGDAFRTALQEASRDLPLVADIRGVGLIVGIELHQPDAEWISFDHFGLGDLSGRPSIGLILCHRLYKRGFFCFVCGHDWRTLRLQPRLEIEPEQLATFVRVFREEVEYLCNLA